MLGQNESCGVMTTSDDKFADLTALAEEMCINVVFDRLAVPGGVEEPVSTNPREVGIGKQGNLAIALQQTTLWEAMRREGRIPDRVLSMDVLPVAPNLKGLRLEQRVMKKPEIEEGTALEVVTRFFEMCKDAIEEAGGIESGIGHLALTYNLLMAESPVDFRTGKIDTRKTRVEWDKFVLNFSLPLVGALADSKQWRQWARQGVDLADILGSNTVRGVKMAGLVPAIATIASLNAQDELNLMFGYSTGRDRRGGKPNTQLILVDKPDDLKLAVRVGRGDDCISEMALDLFLHYATHGVTPALIHKMFTRPKP